MTQHGTTIGIAEMVLAATATQTHELVIIECEDRSYAVGSVILTEYLDAASPVCLCDGEDCGIYTMDPQQCHDGRDYCDQCIGAASMMCCRDCAWDGNIDKDY